ncbi:MAG: hypothetical protein Alpg2KO_01820 [Alphaproteobacteria bacterium]
MIDWKRCGCKAKDAQQTGRLQTTFNAADAPFPIDPKGIPEIVTGHRWMNLVVGQTTAAHPPCRTTISGMSKWVNLR